MMKQAEQNDEKLLVVPSLHLPASVLAIGRGDFHHLEEIGLGGITAALVAGGENESSPLRLSSMRRLHFSSICSGVACSMKCVVLILPLRHIFSEAAFDLLQVYITRGRLFEGFDGG